MGVIDDLIRTLEYWGVIDIVLPFILIFTLIFSVLEKTQVLGQPKDKNGAVIPGKTKKNLNMAIAFVIALSAIVPHVLNPGGPGDVVAIINNALPGVGIVLVAILSVFLLMGMFGEFNLATDMISPWIVILSILTVGYIFLVSGGFMARPPAWLAWVLDPDIRNALIAIIVFGLVIWFITKEEKEDSDGDGAWARFWKDVYTR